MTNQELIEAGREAWNEINRISGDDDMLFESTEEFALFFRSLCTRLFEIEGEAK